MAKKRTYDVESIRTDYEKKLVQQEERERKTLEEAVENLEENIEEVQEENTENIEENIEEIQEENTVVPDEVIEEIQEEITVDSISKENAELAKPITPPPPPDTPYEDPGFRFFDEEYENPDKEDYKRLSLFMDWDVWERIQAMCWSESEAVNKTVVDHLREWSMDVSDGTIEAYRRAMKQKHIDEWAEIRDVIQFWWQTSGIRDTMQIQSYRMNRDSLTVIETSGALHNYYIHRNWITDGTNKLARVKTLIAMLKRTSK